MPFDPTLQDKGSWFYDTSNGQTAPLVGDGVNYSRALGWQSPEGNFYGQERWVRDWYSAVFWDGLDYRIVEADGALSDPSLFSTKAPPNRIPTNFEVWSVPRPDWPPVGLTVYDSRNKDYYFWNPNTQSFQIMDWFGQVEGDDELPYPGYKIGAAHVIVYHDIKVMWNGYYWQRYHHDMLDLGTDAAIHVPEGFIAQNQANVEGLITGLVEAQTAITSITNPDTGDIAALTSSLSNLQNLVGQFSSSTAITYAEAQTWELSKDQLISDATFLEETAADLEITTQLVSYKTAIGGGASPYNNGLIDIIAPWINQAESNYPIAITSGQQSSIAAAFSAAQSAQSALQTAISAAQAAGVQVNLSEFQTLVEGEFTTVNGALSNFDTQFEQYLSDGYISKVESQSLNLSLGLITAASKGVIIAATALAITTELTAYKMALGGGTAPFNNGLIDMLAPWIGQATYPIAITTTGAGTANQRATIEAAFAMVKETEIILQNTIIAVSSSQAQAAAIAAVDITINAVNGDLNSLTDDYNAAFSDSTITIIEANQLAADLGKLQASSSVIGGEATTLGITTELSAYSSDLLALVNGLAPYINQSSYPINLGPNATIIRSNLSNLFQTCQTAETVLVNKIDSVNATNAATSATASSNSYADSVHTEINNYVNGQLAALNSTLSVISPDFTGAFSDLSITLTEATQMSNDLLLLQDQANTLLAIAADLSITTEATTYSNLISALEAELAPFIGQSSYPISATTDQQTAVGSDLATIASAQSALQTAITSAQALGLQVSITNLQSLVSSEFSATSNTLSQLNDLFLQYASDDYITLAEAKSLETVLLKESVEVNTLLTQAAVFSITSEAVACQEAMDQLVTAFSPLLIPFTFAAPITWNYPATFGQVSIDINSYPIGIASTQRLAINSAFQILQQTETALQNAILVATSNQAAADAVSGANANIIALNTDVANLSSDLFLTLSEANSLAKDLVQAQTQTATTGTTLYTIAQGLGITTQLTNYVNAVNALALGLADWLPN